MKDKLGKKEAYDLTIQALLEESDSDDSEDDDLMDDPELERFKQKAGITTSNSSKYGLHSQVTKGGSSSGFSADRLKDEVRIEIPSSQQFTLQAQLPTSSSSALTQTEKINQALNYEISSDSSDDEIDQIIAQTSYKNSGRSGINHLSENNKQDSFASNGLEDSYKNSGVTLDSEGAFLETNRTTLNTVAQDILDIVEKNEKMNEVGPEKVIEHGNQLLSFDNKFYNVQKKLFTYHDFNEISKKLHHQRSHQFGGMVSAITMIQDYIFVGNSSGIIRVFDMKTQKEMKPLMDEYQIGANKVTCIDISEDGGFLISGYKKGQVALWDLINYKMLRFISDIHTTDVINARIYHIDDSENLYAVSSEDSGRVQLIRYTKKSFLGGYSSEAQFLFKTRLKGTATIACQRNSIVAFGSLNEIVVCSMRPIKEIFQINRPSFCKEKSIPYIDWGFGLTPSHRERTVPIMAFAWDRLIQLVYINEETSTVEMDGFYYSDQEINSLFFMGESILFALINGREIKVLYTTKFYPGHFKFLENAKKDDLLNNQFEKVISVTSHAELEKGFEIVDIKSNLLQSQMVMNYNQCVKRYKSSVYFMCGKNIIRGKLFSWKEYLDHIKFKENYDWLTVLKVALEIYTGESKGYAKVPDEKEIREGILKGFMKDMIKESVQQVIYKYNSNNALIRNQDDKKSQLSTSHEIYQADSIAIKVAIEFCLSINAIFFLFSEIYQIFVDQGLENKFMANLEPFILSGQFKKELIPEYIITKLIQYYEERKNFKVLEKVIQQLDLSDYSQRADLIITCEVNCLLSALLYLMSSQSEESLGCMQILNTMLKVMTDAKIIDISKEDIAIISKVESTKKYEIEKSRTYIGYKLFWIMKLFIDGKMFPSGFLTPEKHRIHIYDIVNFITNDYVLDELLQFDCECFFKVVAKLYYGLPFKFLMEQKDYLLKNPVKGTGLCLTPNQVINELFPRKCEGNDLRLEHFYKFLIVVQSNHEYVKPESNPFLVIDYQLMLKAVLFQVNSKKDNLQIDEQLLIKAIKNRKFNLEDIERLLSTLELVTKSLPSLRIYLVEKKKDYVQSFKLNMANSQLRKNIFEWINKTLTKLSSNGATDKPFNDLKDVIQKSVRELITINDGECVALLDKWFEDSYQEQLILEELADYPEIQYNYLKKFLSQNEPKIKQTISEATYSSERKGEASRYMEYLVLHTKLLCKFHKNKVHEFVKKDYYPIGECLEICKENKADRAVAELLRRNGSFIQSIQTYLDIIDKLSRQDMISELYNASKSISSSKKKKGIQWEFLNCQKLPTIHEFDQLLDKSVKITEKQQSIVGEEGWFIVLEFLSQYLQELQDRVYPPTITGGVTQLTSKDKAKLDLLSTFISQRKDLILKRVPTSISLYTLTSRLNLDFKQIKELYDYKVKAVKNNEKYLKLAKNLQEKELLVLQKLLNKQMNKGYHLQEDEKCKVCSLPIQLSVQKVPFRIFHCHHNYHLNCLKDKKCPLCVKQSLEIQSKEELRRNRQGKNSVDLGKEDQKERNMAFMQAQAEAALYGTSLDRNGSGGIMGGNSLFVKRLEVFDQQLENIGLQKASFC